MFGLRPALALGNQAPITYIQLNQRVQTLAQWMRSILHLQEGDRVAIAMKNCTEYTETTLASWHAGLGVVPINHKLHPREIQYIIENSNSKACFSDGEVYKKMGAAGQELGAEFVDVETQEWREIISNNSPPGNIEISSKDVDLAWLFYTSGTTGRPKGAMLSHGNLISMALNFHADVLAIDENDVLIHAAPMSHGSGLYGIPYWMHGGLQVVPISGGFEERELFDLIDHYKLSSLFAAPTIISRMVKHATESLHSTNKNPYENLKCIVSGGAPFYKDEIKSAVQCFGARIAHIYGQGESPMTITSLRSNQVFDAVKNNDDDLLSSVGYPQTSVLIEIKDENNKNLTTNEIGEISILSPTVMAGYWKNPEATGGALKNNSLRTGDIGFVDERGLLHLKDRSKDVIISGGSNIYPREIEEILLQHHDVQEVSVVGLPDAEWGESVGAFIVLRDLAEVNENDLGQLCLQSVARFKRPKHYVFLKKLPKNQTGKILKNELREIYLHEKAVRQKRIE